MKKQSAAETLVARVEWLASIFRGVALGLLFIGILLPAVGTWFWENSFGCACFSLMGMGLLFSLGTGYCRFILKEYHQNGETD